MTSQPDVSPPPSPNCVPSWAVKCAKIQAALEEWKSTRVLLANSIKSYLAACTTLTSVYAQPPYRSFGESAVEQALLTIDSELDTLASEESALRDMRTSLATIRNKSAKLTRINTLPPEILAQIFALSRTHCIQDNSLRFYDLAGVCAYWQQVALNTPDIWTHIDVGPRTPISLTRLLLERTKDNPIHLHLHEPELERLNSRPVPTPDYEVSRTITMLTPHMHRVCTLDLESYSFSRAFICPMLNLWFSRGSTTLPRTLSVYRPIGEQLLYPYGGSKNGMLKSRTEGAQAVLLSLSTLHLHRVKFDWDSGAYRGLVDLRLSLPCQNAAISASQLANILAANPAISILKIAHLRVTSPEDWVPPAPVVLSHLKLLNLANMSPSSLRLLLPLINLPSCPDELSIGLPVSPDSQNELGIFLAGSQINTLYCVFSDSPAWYTLAKSLPCLDTLILHEFDMSDTPTDEENKPSQSAQYSHISSVILLSSVVTFTGLERLVAEHGVPHLSLESCSARSETLHDLQAVRAALLELHPDLKFSISDTDTTSRLPCRTMFDH